MRGGFAHLSEPDTNANHTRLLSKGEGEGAGWEGRVGWGGGGQKGWDGRLAIGPEYAFSWGAFLLFFLLRLLHLLLFPLLLLLLLILRLRLLSFFSFFFIFWGLTACFQQLATTYESTRRRRRRRRRRRNDALNGKKTTISFFADPRPRVSLKFAFRWINPKNVSIVVEFHLTLTRT